tara:strand:+ start:857 stop:1168 length:312 start_codon:yes stop_codon:yes gene_type:complete
MAKTQSYTIVFNEAQNNIDDAFDTVSSGLDAGISTIIANGFVAGNIADISESLSSDKKTLTVSRQWSDSAYDSLIAIQTVDQIKSAVAGLSAVQSIEYEFTDA